MDGVVGSLRDGVEEPIDLLFFRGRVERVVVGDLGDQFFEEIDVGGDVGSMYMPDVFDCIFECFAPLLGKSVIAEAELLAAPQPSNSAAFLKYVIAVPFVHSIVSLL